MIKSACAAVLLLMLSLNLSAQDLNARVQVLSPQIQATNKRVLDLLQAAIRDFLNTRKWSNDNFVSEERIECNFVINIKEWDNAASFKAEAQIQSSRPIFSSIYSSTLLNISDKNFNFTYLEGQALDFSDQNFLNNLTSLLAYYSYIIVGLDYDSFAKLGGTAYFTKAQNIVNNAQNTSFAGWKAAEELNNRYWLSENLNNRSYYPIREALYDYHRNGLDLMSQSLEKGRKNILSMLPKLQKMDKQKQGAMFNQLFFTAKADELVNIFSEAEPQEKTKAYNLLSALDPPNISRYDRLKKRK